MPALAEPPDAIPIPRLMATAPSFANRHLGITGFTESLPNRCPEPGRKIFSLIPCTSIKLITANNRGFSGAGSCACGVGAVFFFPDGVDRGAERPCLAFRGVHGACRQPLLDVPKGNKADTRCFRTAQRAVRPGVGIPRRGVDQAGFVLHKMMINICLHTVLRLAV